MMYPNSESVIENMDPGEEPGKKHKSKCACDTLLKTLKIERNNNCPHSMFYIRTYLYSLHNVAH